MESVPHGVHDQLYHRANILNLLYSIYCFKLPAGPRHDINIFVLVSILALKQSTI